MKKTYLLAMICIAFISCNKDDISGENIQSKNNKIETMDFLSYEKMDQKIDEISMIKMEMERYTAQKYTSNNYSFNKTNVSENSILNDLKKYHRDRLNNIYKLREKLNFTSIQSIADEINSLRIIDNNKYNDLLKKYEPLLKQTQYRGVITVFENRIADVINKEGDVFIDGKSVDFKIPISKTATSKYIGDEIN